jgi:hypothetical protein
MLVRIEKVNFTEKDRANFDGVEHFLEEIIHNATNKEIFTATESLYQHLLDWEEEMEFDEE